MQIYSGPTRRVLRKLKTNTTNGFTVDGIRNQEEERAIYVRQKFTLRQYENEVNDANDNYNYIASEWMFQEEKDAGEFDVRENNDPANEAILLPTPFTGVHDIADRLLLNKTFQSIAFKPDNAHNYLNIENEAQTRIAPLLSAKEHFQNVTVSPIVSKREYEVQDVVNVSLAMYGRYWVGSLNDMPAGVANRNGQAPYFLDNMGADQSAANFEQHSVYGFTPNQMPVGQKVRPAAVVWDVKEHIEFFYDSDRDVYESKSFDINVPWPLNQGVSGGDPAHLQAGISTYQQFIVPAITTSATQGGFLRDTTNITPYNYFMVGDAQAPRVSFPAPGAITAAGVLDEDLHRTDTVAILMDSYRNPIITGYGAGVPPPGPYIPCGRQPGV